MTASIGYTLFNSVPSIPPTEGAVVVDTSSVDTRAPEVDDRSHVADTAEVPLAERHHLAAGLAQSVAQSG